jgi:putative endonuclease
LAERWYVYLARCADGTFYCGITNDLKARLFAHDAGKGAKYTRGRGPLELIWSRACASKGLALRVEHAIKQLPREHKLDRARLSRLSRALARTASSDRAARTPSGRARAASRSSAR